MSNDNVVGINLPGKKRTGPQQAWFEDEDTGFHAEIELNGQTFQVREVSDAHIKAFSAKERSLTKRLQALAKEQKAAEEKADEGLSDDQLNEFTAQSDTILAEQFANSDELLIVALVGWSLPRELSEENIRKLSKSARRKLSELVAQRSTLGADEQSFLAQRSRK